MTEITNQVRYLCKWTYSLPLKNIMDWSVVRMQRGNEQFLAVRFRFEEPKYIDYLENYSLSLGGHPFVLFWMNGLFYYKEEKNYCLYLSPEMHKNVTCELLGSL